MKGALWPAISLLIADWNVLHCSARLLHISPAMAKLLMDVYHMQSETVYMACMVKAVNRLLLLIRLQ